MCKIPMAFVLLVVCLPILRSAVRIDEPSPLRELEGKTVQEKLPVLREYLGGSDQGKKRSAIEELGKLGADGVPMLLDQLQEELRSREKVVLGGEVKEVETKFVYDILFALGRTRDRRIVRPMIQIANSNMLSDKLRGRAILVLGGLGCNCGLPIGPAQSPGLGEEVTQKDVLLIMHTLGHLAVHGPHTSERVKGVAKVALAAIAQNLPVDWFQEEPVATPPGAQNE